MAARGSHLQPLRHRVGREPLDGLVARPLVHRNVLLQDAGVDLGEGGLQPSFGQLLPGLNSSPQPFLRAPKYTEKNRYGTKYVPCRGEGGGGAKQEGKITKQIGVRQGRRS